MKAHSVRPGLRLRGALFFALLNSFVFVGAGLTQDHTNVIVILADDLGYGDVGVDGCLDIPTPNIDALAANGARCTDGYVTHCSCAPSRAGLLTGRYQARFGFDTGPNEDNPNPLLGLPLAETILPQYLKSAGYVSGMIGKWHLGKASFMFPTLRGFDEFVGFLDGDSIYYNADLYRGYSRFREKTYLTDAFTGEAVSFINNHAAEPFFLYLAYNAPHDPYQTPPDIYMERVSYIPDPDRRLYAAMVCALDDGVGQVVQTLTANNILNNTLIFFLSDNGAPYWNSFDGTLQSNAPLRGYKLDMFDGGIRVPFAIQWPARIAPHTLYSGIVSSLDIVPTVAAATGISLPADRIFDGLDIMPYLTGEQPAPDRTLYWRWFGLGDTGPLGAFNPIWAVRSGSLKLVVSRAQDTLPPALFDLSQDIGEMTNLADEKPDLVASLSNLHKQWELIALPALWQKDSDNQLLPLVLAGDWNDFNINDTHFPWVFSHTPSPNRIGTPDAYNWLTSTIHVSSSGGDTIPGTHLFNIVAEGNFKTQWGGTTINIDGITQVTSYSLNELAPPNSITFQDGYYYSVRLIDTDAQPRPHAFMPLSVMKTSATPVSIIRTGQSPPEAIPGEPIVVTMTTSEPKSPEERVYLRWSNDWFITSHIIEATPGGDGVTYSATIPPQPAATICYYTVLTSTADLNPLTTSGFIDELTLAVNGTFSALAIPTPTIVKQPADTNVADGQIAKFQASASGDAPLTYQWRKNGIDIPGATKAVYVSPATTLSDNGALFSAKVTNNRAIIVSRDALLTVQPNPPTIVTEPVDKTVRAGRSTKFSVTATGSLPLTYQWHKNGIDIPGATKATYKTPPTTSGDNGALFSVTVSNSAGSILSRAATLTVR